MVNIECKTIPGVLGDLYLWVGNYTMRMMVKEG